jgi:hypothetical protein
VEAHMKKERQGETHNKEPSKFMVF